MTQSELVPLFVLDAICDDYENVDQVIAGHVVRESAKCGFTAGRTEVVAALATLIEDGLAKAYLLSEREPRCTELQGMPPVDVENDFKTYFYITKKGMDLHLSDNPEFPFDDDGELRPGWRLRSD